MAICYLGEKKTLAIERAIGRSVSCAYVRGGWPHHAVAVEFADGAMPRSVWFDRRTMEIESVREICRKAGPLRKDARHFNDL